MTDHDVIVVGGGAAGMMAALTAAEAGCDTLLLEKNEKLGKKLFITGKGRCNLTNSCPVSDIFDHIVTNERFMYSSLYSFTNDDVMSFFESRGLRLKTERGGRVFPVSDHSSDVIKCLERSLKEAGCSIKLNTAVKELVINDGVCTGVVLENGGKISTGKVIVATGGLSYPSTGSTGDGYRFAKKAGLKVTATTPSLVPFNAEKVCKDLQGLTLKNVGVTLKNKNKELYSGFGELLFTHFGVSGPTILTASAGIRPADLTGGAELTIDLKSALSEKEVDERLLREIDSSPAKEYRNLLKELLPSKMIPVAVDMTGVDGTKKAGTIKREEREKIAAFLKGMKIRIDSMRGFEEAVITKGGVDVKELDPKTMASKKVKGLYFAGEVIDVDAHTGGYNLQIAWSTGRAAGTPD